MKFSAKGVGVVPAASVIVLVAEGSEPIILN